MCNFGSASSARAEAFWDRFDDADLDEQFEVAADTIKNGAWFDGEDAFYLFVEALETPALEHNRREPWMELLGLLRDRRPELLKEESAFLGRSALRIALAAEDEEWVERAVDILFDDPGTHIGLVLNSLPKLAYRGMEGIYGRLRDGASQLEKVGLLAGRAAAEWTEWAIWFLTADWADDDINRARDVDELAKALGGMADELDVEFVREGIHRFIGPDAADVDADSIAQIDDRKQRSATVGFGFGRHLIDEYGWDSQKAVLAARYLGPFLNDCADVKDPFNDRYTTDEARKTKLLNRELKKLREPWENDGEFTPHPDLAVGYTGALRVQGELGEPYSAAAFFEAAVRLAPWMEMRGLIGDAALVEQIQQHFRRRIASVSKQIEKYIGSDPVVVRGLEDAGRWLTKGA